jgi:putative ABC transport system ATP-binding protein
MDAHRQIELQGIQKAYPLGEETLYALHDVALTIDYGECVAIMGPSGSGKSTLMNIIGCLDRPTAGNYFLEGADVSSMDKAALAGIRNRHIGFVFQSFNLLPRTSAVENVELPLLYAGIPAGDRKQRAIEALQRVGLGDRLGHTPGQMSGGQQQRVAIARAMVTRPRLILADEPTGNLDSKTSLEIMALFQALWRSGITIIFVTHEAEIAEFAARIIVVKDGAIVSDQRREPKGAEVPA